MRLLLSPGRRRESLGHHPTEGLKGLLPCGSGEGPPQLVERDPVLGAHSGRGGTSEWVALDMVRLSDPLPDVPGTSVPTAATPWGRRWADCPQGDRASQGVQSVEDHPGSWGTPSVRSPCSVDADRTADTRPVRCRGAAPGIRRARAPTKGLSTLNSMAFGLAVCP